MHIRDLYNKNICIIGYGQEGQAMADALNKFAPGSGITIADRNPNLERKNLDYEYQLGRNYLQDLDRFDVVIKSPGIPPVELINTEIKLLTTPTRIFFDTIKEAGSTIIGITGSKGKSTTSSLIYSILKKAGVDTHLIGNIGFPSVGYINHAKPNTIFVHELSSYQLIDLDKSPHIAVITAFFPEHLDYHGSVQTYMEAKKRIARFQGPEDTVIYNGDSDGCRQIGSEGRGKRITFTASDSPVRIEETSLIGRHNLSNIGAAFKVSSLLEIPKSVAVEAICEFKSLPHRLQSIGVISGIEWVDDSISTTPQSAIAALDALGERVITVILGGQDRGYDFTPLIDCLKSSSVKIAVLLPESGRKIGKLLKGSGITTLNAETMEEAVKLSKKETIKAAIKNKRSMPIILLSPASPSYGYFKNFEDRGDQFAVAAKS